MLKQRILEFEKKHGGLRAAARVLDIDPGYLLRLRDGEKNNPSSVILKKLKLRRVIEIRYEKIGNNI
jgi:hypothetical protein